MTTPRVSVVMSVYNGARDAPQAIDCILSQTYKDLELIAIDNGSTRDDTRATLQKIASQRPDPRLRVICLDHNIGLAGALNHGIGLAHGEFVARQDHDDVSRPTRIEKLVALFDQNPRLGLAGTRAEIWVGETPDGRAHDHPEANIDLQFSLLFNNPFVHSSVMMRRSALDAVGLYATDPARQPPEDYELWSRIARRFEVANVPERLLVYREVANSMSRVGANPFQDKLVVLASENIAWWCGLESPDEVCVAVAALIHGKHQAVPHGISYDAMAGVVSRAATGISNRFGDSDRIERQLQDALSSLRHQLALHRSVPGWGWALAPIVRRHPVLRSAARAARKLWRGGR